MGMNILKKIGCWFLSVICACVGMVIDYLIIIYNMRYDFSCSILVMIMFSALFGLFAFLLIIMDLKPAPVKPVTTKSLYRHDLKKKGKQYAKD